MSESRMILHREELERVLELMTRFDNNTIELVQHSGGGIGYTLNAHIETTVADTQGVYIVEITGVKDW